MPRMGAHGRRDRQVAGEVGQQGPGQVGPIGHRVESHPGVEDRWPDLVGVVGIRHRPPGGAAGRPSACRRATASSGLPTAGARRRARITSSAGMSARMSTVAHRRSPWPTVTSAPANVRPRWVTSTSNPRGRASSTARVNTAWAERTRWSGSSFEAATTAWASSWLPSTTRRAPPSLDPDTGGRRRAGRRTAPPCGRR